MAVIDLVLPYPVRFAGEGGGAVPIPYLEYARLIHGPTRFATSVDADLMR